MTIDHNIAKHICNVVRRQVQNAFPDLYLEFILHENDERATVFEKEKTRISELPADSCMVDYIQNSDISKILEKNRSRFVAIASNTTHGFMGFFKSNDYMALCFINYSEFDSEDNLRNQAFHIAWHAINTYKIHENKNNILTPSATKKQLCHNNLMADIFSASIQLLQGRANSLESLARQRINETLTPKTGVFTEKFPFPVCLDTLEFMFDNNIDQYKDSKIPVINALNIADKIGKTFEETAPKQWTSFCFPAQEMAWAGYSPNMILGAALYTSENPYVQSIADMVADRIDIKPETVTYLQDYNPFADSQTNERSHNKQCDELINNLLDKVKENGDCKILIEIAKKQNNYLLEKSPMGWCAAALIAAANVIKESTESEISSDILSQARQTFDEEVASLPWDTLAHFSKIKFQYMRSKPNVIISDIALIANSADEFSSIYRAISDAQNFPDNEES